MTADVAVSSRVRLPPMPPWLWLWLAGDLIAGIPGEVSQVRYEITLYSGHGSLPPQLTAQTPYKLLSLFAVVAVLPSAVLIAGALAAMFPQLRGRWVEWRFGLTADQRDVMAEMQRFVAEHDPFIQLRFTIRSDQMARIYPAGWRKARIAVFRPLTALWRRDQDAARAILLHEVAHRRQGDHLIAGLGSPFIWLIQIWAPAFVLLVLTPLAAYFILGGGELARAVSGQGVIQVAQVPEALLLPVTALWLAELSADQLAVRVCGPGAVLRALQTGAGSRPPVIVRAANLLSHPPRRLRSRRVADRPAGTAALLAAWPAALVGQLLITTVAAVPALLLIGNSLSQVGSLLPQYIHSFLLSSRTILIVTAVILVAWPAAAGLWERLWWPSAPLALGRPWWPYLAAAALPVALLLLSLDPFQASRPPVTRATAPQGICSRIAVWQHGGGPAQNSRVAADVGKIFRAGRNQAAAVAALDTAIGKALQDLPPGAAGTGYADAMADFRAAAHDVLAGQARPGLADAARGVSADIKADSLLASQQRKCS